MTGIKNALQRDIFTPNNERLLSVIHVCKTGSKKKKSTLLCASVTIDKPVQVYISKVKKQEKSDTYKKQKIWHLRELKIVNGKDTDLRESCDFDLQFDKNFKWTATSVGEKHSFLSCITKLCNRYLTKQQKPDFFNLPNNILEVSLSAIDATRSIVITGPDDALEDYQALTKQEEFDLEKMLSECEDAISDAEAFASSLSKNLSVLDGQNIHSIMGSESQVNALMLLLDKALGEVSRIETSLNEYESMVEAISMQMGQIKNQESFIQITNKNHATLLEELDKLVMQLDLSKGHIKALREADLSMDSGIAACTSAAEALQEALAVELPLGLSKLQAVTEQQKLFDSLRRSFAKRLYDHLALVFAKQGTDHSINSLARFGTELRLPKHFPYHRDLLPYKGLVLWMKVADKTKYTQLCTAYSNNVSKLYSQEIKDFMIAAKQRFSRLDSGGSRTLTTSSSSLSRDKKTYFGSTQSLAAKVKIPKIRKKKRNLGASKESLAASDLELSDREKFSSTFREVLNELEPACQDEEGFLVKFFHLNVEHADMMMPGGSDDEEDATDQGVINRRKYQEAQVTKEIRGIMNELFAVVVPELSSLIAFGEQLDSLNSLNMLVVIGQRIAQAQQDNDDSFLAKMLGNCLIEIKRKFDDFVNNKVKLINDAHLGKGKKCGIFPFVYDFEDFVELAESIFRDSNRRADIDKAYKTLIKAVFIAIDRVASESPKIPPEVVMFENYHHLLDCLNSVKIASLEQEKREVKARYLDNLQSYVTVMLGRPLEKLSNFFEGVEQVMASGVRAEEVGFQLKYSKQELRKCIKEYSGKDVKKGLETMHHKIVKHTSEHENRLLQVVWQHMQDEFLKQYKHFQELITKCYPDSELRLEFTINDVLQYFSDIAQSQ